jgi:SAM-dependent methyltransferase
MVARDGDNRWAGRDLAGRAEGVALALDDEHGYAGHGELGGSRNLWSGRGVKGECQADDRGGVDGGRGAAGNPRPAAAASGDERTQVIEPESGHDLGPGGVEDGRSVRSPAAPDPIGLLDAGDGPAGAEQPPAYGDEIRRVDPATGSVAEHNEPATAAGGEVDPGGTGRGVPGDRCVRQPTPPYPSEYSRPMLRAGDASAPQPRDSGEGLVPAAPPVAVRPDPAPFESFVAEVAYAQLAEWLPATPQVILDLSPGCPRLLTLMAEHGHTVVHAVRDPERPALQHERVWRLRADGRSLDWLGSQTVDLVVAEGGALSSAVAAEITIDDLYRVLRPGGRVLLCVDSLVAGLSRLADQGRWAELADVPAADVVLVPEYDGSVTRCFWPEELHGLLADGGFEVEWIRPRTVLAEETVTRALLLDPLQLPSLVRTELALAVQRQGESIGGQLIASALRR